ncbi:hypothetical protein AB0C02_23065 [Micromonospora sp. NPDC048999]|uniref:hypothetical protein n=1 Tax=Micromonospora sp. NPDC048999 TaxID=3155391 RepID=UPI0033DB7C42
MVERHTDPQPVSLRHGAGRLADGDRVPVPPLPPPPPRRLRVTVLACVFVVALAVVIGALR